jgi:hypothetical protein
MKTKIVMLLSIKRLCFFKFFYFFIFLYVQNSYFVIILLHIFLRKFKKIHKFKKFKIFKFRFYSFLYRTLFYKLFSLINLYLYINLKFYFGYRTSHLLS